MNSLAPRVTRLAPSPTGSLHLGNARTFLINWLLARQGGWRIALRIEDLDAGRAKPGSDQQAMDDLRWLGIDWDSGPTYQLDHLEVYGSRCEQLLQSGAAYPCICSRAEATLAGSAPHAEDGGTIYPGTCRGRFSSLAAAHAATGREPCVRFTIPAGPIEWIDGFGGTTVYTNPQAQLGDFVISRPGGLAAYQLAVVIDDIAANVTEIVRGDDLLASAARQILIYRALGIVHQIPRYVHLPLLVGTDGRRLAKRHGDTRISQFRVAGVPAGRVRAYLARASGVECGESIEIDELIEDFKLANVPRNPIVVEQSDLERLLN